MHRCDATHLPLLILAVFPLDFFCTKHALRILLWQYVVWLVITSRAFWERLSNRRWKLGLINIVCFDWARFLICARTSSDDLALSYDRNFTLRSQWIAALFLLIIVYRKLVATGYLWLSRLSLPCLPIQWLVYGRLSGWWFLIIAQVTTWLPDQAFVCLRSSSYLLFDALGSNLQIRSVLITVTDLRWIPFTKHVLLLSWQDMVTFVIDVKWYWIEVNLVWNQSWKLSMAVVNLICRLLQMWWVWLSLLLITCIVLCLGLNSSECLWVDRCILVRVRCSNWYSSQIRITFLFRWLVKVCLSLNIGCITFTCEYLTFLFIQAISQQRAVIGLAVLNCNCLVFERHLVLKILRSVVIEAIDREFGRVRVPSLFINVLPTDILGVQIRSDILAIWWLIKADHIFWLICILFGRLLEGWKNLIVAVTWVKV